VGIHNGELYQVELLEIDAHCFSVTLVAKPCMPI